MSHRKYVHGHHESVLRSHRWRTVENSAMYLKPHIVPGMSLLDVGCGPGTLTADLAELVAPGSVVAVDASADVLGTAREFVGGRRLRNVSFVSADMRDADLGTFDVVHAHQLVQHLVAPVEALRRLARFVAPGGILACRDADYLEFAWSPPDSRLDRWLHLYTELARSKGLYPDAGARLALWVEEAGLPEAVFTQSEWTFVNPKDRRWWGETWAERTTFSEFAEQVVEAGLSNHHELYQLAEGWREWAQKPEGMFVVPHGEVLVRF